MDAIRTVSRSRGAIGTVDMRPGIGAASPQIAIRFPRARFNQIERMARAADISFAEQVRQLVDQAINGKHETPF